MSSWRANSKIHGRRPAHRVTWDPAIDQTHTQQPVGQQPPIPAAYIYAYEAIQAGQSLPLYIYSWPVPDVPDGLEGRSGSEGEGGEDEDEEEEEESPVNNYQVVHQASSQSVSRSRDSVIPNQYVTVPGWQEYEAQDQVPSLRSVPITARRGVIVPPPRTKGGFTPHPMVQNSFRQQMENRPQVGAYHQRGSTTDPTFFPNHFSISSSAIPETSAALPGPMPPRPWNGTNELVDGKNYFRMYDVVYVPVWSYLRNVFVWTKGTVLQPVLRMDRNGMEERCYKVCIKNPDDGEDDYVIVSPVLGQIIPAPNENLSPKQLATPRDVPQPPPASGASHHRASHLKSGMRIEKGTYVFNQASWSLKKDQKPRRVWVPGVCIMPNKANGYWIRALGGPVKGIEYLSYGPFKTFGKQTLKELQQAGEAVDVTGCDSFV